VLARASSGSLVGAKDGTRRGLSIALARTARGVFIVGGIIFRNMAVALRRAIITPFYDGLPPMQDAPPSPARTLYESYAFL